jgi:hypothetical protein
MGFTGTCHKWCCASDILEHSLEIIRKRCAWSMTLNIRWRLVLLQLVFVFGVLCFDMTGS